MVFSLNLITNRHIMESRTYKNGSVEVSMDVAYNKFGQFHALMVERGGRYLMNPSEFTLGTKRFISVCFEMPTDDYTIFQENWIRSTQDVVEVRKDQWWRKLSRRYFGIEWE